VQKLQEDIFKDFDYRSARPGKDRLPVLRQQERRPALVCFLGGHHEEECLKAGCRWSMKLSRTERRKVDLLILQTTEAIKALKKEAKGTLTVLHVTC
jgi:hypothetical protein